MPSYVPSYATSRALVIGINDYANASPLEYAVSDAASVADVLIRSFGFDAKHVTRLTDRDANKQTILDSFLRFALDDVSPDDRVFVFFAGHGHTILGNRGEVGFLVPADGDPRNIASLIRWDELTRNADLIRAKHVLFIMDACYGGLAITRALPPGSMRFLKDMLLRTAHQVLTAGKADEVVADSGGPIPGHSIFTGHFLEALQGKAQSEGGVLTANGVMSYVYQRVANDQHSNQTPHYGYLSGDGDFIFAAPILADAKESPDETDNDTLIAVPSLMTHVSEAQPKSDVENAKEYLAEPRDKIKLDDLLSLKTRQLVPALSAPEFSTSAPVSPSDVLDRMRKYESLTEEMRALVSVIAYWAREEHMVTLRKPLVRLCDQLTVQGGAVAWIGLRWYPVDLLVCAASIAALAARNYRALNIVMQSGVSLVGASEQSAPICVAVEYGLQDAHRANVFKALPGYERNYVPRSEYLFKVLQPQLDDLLFLGSDYEELFDYMEIMRALVFADFRWQANGSVWAPIGRFGWKYRNGRGSDPFTRLYDEATRKGSAWEPLGANFFGGDISRFKELATRVRDEQLAKLPWH